jgi:hypothetical protein
LTSFAPVLRCQEYISLFSKLPKNQQRHRLKLWRVNTLAGAKEVEKTIGGLGRECRRKGEEIEWMRRRILGLEGERRGVRQRG